MNIVCIFSYLLRCRMRLNCVIKSYAFVCIDPNECPGNPYHRCHSHYSIKVTAIANQLFSINKDDNDAVISFMIFERHSHMPRIKLCMKFRAINLLMMSIIIIFINIHILHDYFCAFVICCLLKSI